MAKLVRAPKACSVNPLKSSAPVGAALAYLGLEGGMPLFHGSQGCTAFAMVLMVRHFREAIPLQTTAMSEVSTVLGGHDNLEQAILNIRGRAKPKLIGIASTALTETRGEDVAGDLKLIRARHPELADTALVFASTPDYAGGLQEGWAKAAIAVVDQLVEPGPKLRRAGRVAVFPGVHHTPAEIDAVRAALETFGLAPVFVPDISSALDGHVPERWIPHSLGGAKLDDIVSLGTCEFAIGLAEHMRGACEALERRANVPFRVFPTLTGLGASDAFVAFLAERTGKPVPENLRRGRSRLIDAMLDGHFHFGGRKVALAGEPDHLYALARFVSEMGAEIAVAVTTTDSSKTLLETLPCDEVVVGDLGDFEARAGGCDLLVAHAHGRQASERLGIELMRVGFPIFDRLGAADRDNVLYRGTRALIFEMANIFQAHVPHATPETWRAPAAEAAHAPAAAD